MRNKILNLIEQNSKINTKELAIMLNYDEDEIKKEIEKMEKERIICGYHTLVNWDNTETEVVSALIEVRVTPQRGLGFDKIAERIYNYPEVSAVYLMSGAFDLAVMIEAKSMKEISKFVFEKLATIEFVQNTTTNFVLKKYKDHKTILVEEKKDQRELVNL